jgi:general secretion pathway protein H
MTRARGATLIELVVVLAIMGIVLGVVGLAPRVAPPPQEALVRAVTETLQEARRSALTSGRAVTVIVDATDGRLWIRQDGNEDRLVELPRATDARLAQVALRTSVRFEPSGTAAGEAIDVRGPTGTTRIAVDPATGDLRTDVAR